VASGGSGIGEAPCQPLARVRRADRRGIDGDGARRVAAPIAQAGGHASACTVAVAFTGLRPQRCWRG
jgi:hypothetical protein